MKTELAICFYITIRPNPGEIQTVRGCRKGDAGADGSTIVVVAMRVEPTNMVTPRRGGGGSAGDCGKKDKGGKSYTDG